MDQSGLCRAVCLVPLGGCLGAPAAREERDRRGRRDCCDCRAWYAFPRRRSPARSSTSFTTSSICSGWLMSQTSPTFAPPPASSARPSVGSLMSTAIPGSCRVALCRVRPRCQKDRRSRSRLAMMGSRRARTGNAVAPSTAVPSRPLRRAACDRALEHMTDRSAIAAPVFGFHVILISQAPTLSLVSTRAVFDPWVSGKASRGYPAS